ncbi:hypothetical protein HY249_03470 [Candidatus Azambacteria bacterium]|nr:hypothetical protein [Candidatus Azambacteria bacterium]
MSELKTIDLSGEKSYAGIKLNQEVIFVLSGERVFVRNISVRDGEGVFVITTPTKWWKSCCKFDPPIAISVRREYIEPAE